MPISMVFLRTCVLIMITITLIKNSTYNLVELLHFRHVLACASPHSRSHANSRLGSGPADRPSGARFPGPVGRMPRGQGQSRRRSAMALSRNIGEQKPLDSLSARFVSFVSFVVIIIIINLNKA